MTPETSPFTPHQPASADIFTGREDHVKSLLAAVRRAKQGNITTAWIGGERGIGKTSLAAFACTIAERKENALCAHIPLGGVNSMGEMAKATYHRVLEASRDKPWWETMRRQFGKRVEEVGIFGMRLRLNLPDNELPDTMESFAEQLAHLAKKSGKDALTLVFDDINGIAGENFFANGIKSMAEGIAVRKKPVPVCMLFVGWEERLEEMRARNPSVLRCFDPLIRLQLWSKEEGEGFFRRAFNRAGAFMDDEDITNLGYVCGGMPAIAHEVGDAVWRKAGDKNITGLQVDEGVFAATDSIGERFLQREIIDALRSETYRSILGKIAAKLDVQFTKQELLASDFLTGDEKKGIDGFLKRMRDLGGIIPVKGKRGVYRFPSVIHRFYYESGKGAVDSLYGQG